MSSSRPVKLTGWWDKNQNQWVEDAYQVGSDSGNMAWAMLALLALHKTSGDARYLDAAKRIAAYLDKSFEARAPAGFNACTFAVGGSRAPPMLASASAMVRF